MEPAATDGEHVEAIRQRIPWLHWPYVLVPAVPLVLLLVAAVALWPEVHARLEVGDYRAAKQHVQEFIWPAELHDDPTLTACSALGTRCARTGFTPQAALRATADALAKVGVDLDPERCGADADPMLALAHTPMASDCAAVAHAGGFSVYAIAWEYAPAPATSAPVPLAQTQVSLVVVAEDLRLDELAPETAAPRTSAALPLDIADVPGLPDVFDPLLCTQPAAGGCRQFDGVLTMRDADAADLDDVATQLTADLRAGGYFVYIPGCRDTDAGRQCTVSAIAYRSAGANDLTTVVAMMKPDPAGGLTVRASVTAP